MMTRPNIRRPRLISEIAETAILILLVYTLVNLATVRFYIEGPSMQPSFYAEQYLIVSRVHYLFGEPQRGDIVVFDPPGDDDRPNDPLLIKRLIGLPGDRIEIRDQQLYVNGEPADTSFTAEPCDASHCRDASWELGPNEYFLMGDNRNNSRDSRVFGAVTRDRLVGEAIVRYWPLTELGIGTRYRFP